MSDVARYLADYFELEFDEVVAALSTRGVKPFVDLKTSEEDRVRFSFYEGGLIEVRCDFGAVRGCVELDYDHNGVYRRRYGKEHSFNIVEPGY
ncbi:MAG: hypothetical protein AB8B83_02760 [Bdellovibrionales bacterium]